jgi:lipoate-protein ligase A
MALLIDSGLRSGAWNQALDREWLRRHAAGAAPDLLRFHRNLPTASLGRHQDGAKELRLDYCREKGVEVVCRPSGGGALYLDAGQQAFSLVLPAPSGVTLAETLEKFARAVAQGLRGFGVDAQFKFPNDLEVEGRKLASVFAAEEGGSLLLHGTLLLGAEVRTMLETLRVPTEKLSPDGLAAARDRFAPLGELLGDLPPARELQAALALKLAKAFGLDLLPTFTLPFDIPENTAPLPAADRPAAGEALWKAPGGHLYCRLEIEEGQCLQAAFSGDLQFRPAGWLEGLGAHLAGRPLENLEPAAAGYCARHPLDGAGFAAADAREALKLALRQHAAGQAMGLTAEETSALMLFGDAPPRDTLEKSSVMLVPYCAKPSWCSFRHQDGCSECGKCEVGDAYRLGRERGMQVTTVTNYEQLESTLAEMKAREVEGYVGMCCGQFFLKRHRAFQEAGIPAVLMDIRGANCYELKQESDAYAGKFQAEAKLDAELLHKVVKFIPPRGA